MTPGESDDDDGIMPVPPSSTSLSLTEAAQGRSLSRPHWQESGRRSLPVNLVVTSSIGRVFSLTRAWGMLGPVPVKDLTYPVILYVCTVWYSPYAY